MANYVQGQNYQPFVKPYVEGATKEYADLQKRLTQDYDEAAMQYDALQEAKDNMKKLSWKADDVAAADQVFDAASKEIEAAAKAGDYENRGRLIRKAISAFKEGYAPILSNYQADIKKREEMMKFDKIVDPLERERAYNKLSRLYNQVPQENISYDSRGRVIVSPYRDFNAAADANAVEIADKIAEGWKADKGTTIPYRVVRDGIEVIEQQSIEKADENEIFNHTYNAVANNPEIKAYYNQKFLLNRENYDLNKYDPKAVELARQRNPDASDAELAHNLYVHGEIQNAANFAAKKHGFIKSDFEYKFDPVWEAEQKAYGERKAASVTAITASTSSDFKVDLNGINTVRQTLNDNVADLTKKVNSTNDPVVKSELNVQLNKAKTKLRLQDELYKNIESKANWNWGKTYADYAADVRKEGGSPLPFKEFSTLVKSGNFEEGFSSIKAEGPSLNLFENSNIQKARKYFTNYKDAIDNLNKTNGFIQEHELVEGNESTYSGQYTKLLTNRLKQGNVEFLTQAGQQLNLEKDFPNADLGTLNIIPTKSLIAGKPGYAITATDKDGKNRKTIYTVMDDATSNIEDYQQNGYDLLKQSKSSKYADSPQKKNQLRNTGLMQIGYATEEGKNVSEMNLPVVRGGTKEQPTKLPITDNMDVHVITSQGVNVYKLYNTKTKKYIVNPEDNKADFGSEEDLIRTLGINNILMTNPNIL
jgi:hypothetical protein